MTEFELRSWGDALSAKGGCSVSSTKPKGYLKRKGRKAFLCQLRNSYS